MSFRIAAFPSRFIEQLLRNALNNIVLTVTILFSIISGFLEQVLYFQRSSVLARQLLK
jgi:hypothetical protein